MKLYWVASEFVPYVSSEQFVSQKEAGDYLYELYRKGLDADKIGFFLVTDTGEVLYYCEPPEGGYLWVPAFDEPN